ncbi:UrcA family protein [Flavisphingomonas formosensis]|uniref:UrcA family protein n=1 Tax=Flavisphingomonas formosensis TaxID=861534 RepID=UPI0018DEF7E9|nr:UrcA family protein [Sphingomonas formosensis]
MKTTLMLVATLGSALAVPAFAADSHGSTERVEVRYHDLNLATAEGTSTLGRRISNAATEICGTADVRDLAMRNAVNQCRTAAIASTQTQVAEAVSAAQRGQAYAQANSSIAVSR